MATSAGRFPDGLRGLAPPLGFVLTAVVATWPMATKLGTHLPGFGPNTDNLFHLVFSRWFAVALGQGQNPWRVWWTLFPAGSDSFLGKNGTCFNAALSAPLQPFVGLLAAVNLTGMGLLAFNGWAAFRLVHHLTRHRAAAFLAGVVLMMVPYNASMLGALSFDQLSVGWALTFLLYLLRTVEEPGWKTPALCGLSFFLTCFSFLGYGLIFGGVGAIVLAWALLAHRAWPDRPLLGRMALVAVVAGLLCAPLAMAFTLSGGASTADPAAAGSFPLALAPSRATLVHRATRIVLDNSLCWRDVLALQGASALFAAAALLLVPRRAALWALLALGFCVLALGPYLHNDDGRWLPLPGLLLYHLGGVFSRFRFPFRFVIVTWVAVAVLSGLGAEILARRWAHTPARVGLALAAALACLVGEAALRKDGLVPIPHFRAPEVPRFYREVLATEPDAAVLSVPLLLEKPSKEAEQAFPEPMWHPLEMYYQAFHGHRTLAGPETAVQPPPVFSAFVHSLLVQDILAMQQDADAEPLLISERELSALDELGFGWVVLNERWLARPNADAIHGYLTQLFGLPERYAGDGVSVWDVRGRGPLRQGAGPYEWLYPRSPAAEAALAEAERTFPVEPGGPGPWEEAGRLALAAGEPEKAERYLARAVESGSRDAELIVHWMLLRFRGRRWDEVVEVAPAVIEGRTLAAPFAAAFARVAAAQIATHEGGDPTGCKELAAVCLRENQVREALPCLEAQRAQGTADAATEALLGQAYEALGWPSLALDAYRRAQALDPGVEVDLSRVLVPDTEHLVAGRP